MLQCELRVRKLSMHTQLLCWYRGPKRYACSCRGEHAGRGKIAVLVSLQVAVSAQSSAALSYAIVRSGDLCIHSFALALQRAPYTPPRSIPESSPSRSDSGLNNLRCAYAHACANRRSCWVLRCDFSSSTCGAGLKCRALRLRADTCRVNHTTQPYHDSAPYFDVTFTVNLLTPLDLLIPSM